MLSLILSNNKEKETLTEINLVASIHNRQYELATVRSTKDKYVFDYETVYKHLNKHMGERISSSQQVVVNFNRNTKSVMLTEIAGVDKYSKLITTPVFVVLPYGFQPHHFVSFDFPNNLDEIDEIINTIQREHLISLFMAFRTHNWIQFKTINKIFDYLLAYIILNKIVITLRSVSSPNIYKFDCSIDRLIEIRDLGYPYEELRDLFGVYSRTLTSGENLSKIKGVIEYIITLYEQQKLDSYKIDDELRYILLANIERCIPYTSPEAREKLVEILDDDESQLTILLTKILDNTSKLQAVRLISEFLADPLEDLGEEEKPRWFGSFAHIRLYLYIATILGVAGAICTPIAFIGKYAETMQMRMTQATLRTPSFLMPSISVLIELLAKQVEKEKLDMEKFVKCSQLVMNHILNEIQSDIKKLGKDFVLDYHDYKTKNNNSCQELKMIKTDPEIIKKRLNQEVDEIQDRLDVISNNDIYDVYDDPQKFWDSWYNSIKDASWSLYLHNLLSLTADVDERMKYAYLAGICADFLLPQYKPHMLIVSNPKTGKTTMASYIGTVISKVTQASLLGFTIPFMGRRQGIVENKGGVIAIDQIDAFKDQELFGHMLDIMDRGTTDTASGGDERTIETDVTFTFLSNPLPYGNAADKTVAFSRLIQKVSLPALGRRVGVFIYDEDMKTVTTFINNPAITISAVKLAQQLIGNCWQEYNAICKEQAVLDWLETTTATDKVYREQCQKAADKLREDLLTNIPEDKKFTNYASDVATVCGFIEALKEGTRRARGSALSTSLLYSLPIILALNDDKTLGHVTYERMYKIAIEQLRHYGIHLSDNFDKQELFKIVVRKILQIANEILSIYLEMNLQSVNNLANIVVDERDKLIRSRIEDMSKYKQAIIYSVLYHKHKHPDCQTVKLSEIPYSVYGLKSDDMIKRYETHTINGNVDYVNNEYVEFLKTLGIEIKHITDENGKLVDLAFTYTDKVIQLDLPWPKIITENTQINNADGTTEN